MKSFIKKEAYESNVKVVTTWIESGLPEEDKGTEDIKPWIHSCTFLEIAARLQEEIDAQEQP